MKLIRVSKFFMSAENFIINYISNFNYLFLHESKIFYLFYFFIKRNYLKIHRVFLLLISLYADKAMISDLQGIWFVECKRFKVNKACVLKSLQPLLAPSVQSKDFLCMLIKQTRLFLIRNYEGISFWILLLLDDS